MLGDCKDWKSYKVIPDSSMTKQSIRFLMAKSNVISEEDLRLKSLMVILIKTNRKITHKH